MLKVAKESAKHAIRRATKIHDKYVNPGGGRREAAERLRSCGEHVHNPLTARYPVMGYADGLEGERRPASAVQVNSTQEQTHRWKYIMVGSATGGS